MRKRSSKVAKWKFLDKIKPFQQHDVKKEVGMLIGAIFPRALEHIWWSFQVKEVYTPSEQLLVGVSLVEIMLKLFNQDFSKNSKADGCEKIWMEDKKFIKIMDENVKFIDGHYKLPLPFKDQNLESQKQVFSHQTCVLPREKAADK